MIIMVMALICHATTAQKISADKVPAAAVNAFKAKFPDASNVKWEIEKKDVYEVNFTAGKVKKAAQFDKSGVWQKTETEIEVSQLPKTVSEAFAKSYPGYKIKEVEQVSSSTYTEAYELEIVKGAEKKEVLLSPDGKLIKE